MSIKLHTDSQPLFDRDEQIESIERWVCPEINGDIRYHIVFIGEGNWFVETLEWKQADMPQTEFTCFADALWACCKEEGYAPFGESFNFDSPTPRDVERYHEATATLDGLVWHGPPVAPKSVQQAIHKMVLDQS